MATFHYEAVAVSGERVKGRVEADDALSAIQALQNGEGYHVTAMRSEEEFAELEAERRKLRAEQEHLLQQKLEAEAGLERAKVKADETTKKLKKKRKGLFQKTVTKELDEEEAPKEPGALARWKQRRDARRAAKAELATANAGKQLEAEVAEGIAAQEEKQAQRATQGAAKDSGRAARPMSSWFTRLLGRNQPKAPARTDAAIAEEANATTGESPTQVVAGEAEHAVEAALAEEMARDDAALEAIPEQVFVQALAAAVRRERDSDPKPAMGFWDKVLLALAPGYAAKRASALAAQASAQAAAEAFESAEYSAKTARHLAETAAGNAEKIAAASEQAGDAQTRYSPTLSVMLTNRRATVKERIGIAMRHRGHKRHHIADEQEGAGSASDRAEEAGTPAQIEGGAPARILPSMGVAQVEERESPAPVQTLSGQSMGDASIPLDITKSITGKSASGVHHEAEVATERAKETVDRLRLDIGRIDIEEQSFRVWFQKFLLKLRLHFAQSALRREEKRKARIEAKEKKREALLNKLRAKRMKRLQKELAAKRKIAEKKGVAGQQEKTVVMATKKADTGPVPWYAKLFPFLFKSKRATDDGTVRHNFSMSDEEKQKEVEKQRLLIQGFKATGNPFTDTFNKINEFFIQHQGVKVKELVTLYNLMSTMVNAGIPLVKSLHQLVEQEKNPRMKRILFQTVYEIENGKSLSKALRSFPDVFNDATLGMIEAGEASGQLGSVLKRIAEEAEKSHKMLSKVKGALIYPIVILTILTLVMIVVMVMVVPKMVEVFDGAGVELPLPTRVLIAMSNFIINRWYILVAVAGIIAFSFRTYTHTEEGKYYWDYTKLKFPIFGALFTKVSLARFTRSLSTLSSSGLSIIKALRINADSIGNQVYRQEVLATAESVKKGVSIAKDLSGNKLFPAMVVDMIAVGEETAQVANVSMKISEFYEAEVEDMVKNMQSLMEPIIIVVVGVMVGGLVAAIMLPIMSLSEVATKG